jgi:raffinose/stachyose/melibiose transport system permease protein
MFYGFFDWNGIGQPRIFSGLKNYRSVFTDTVMLIVLRNTMIYMIVTTSTRVLLGMYLAYIIKCGVPLGNFIKTLLYIPAIISFAVLGVVFGNMLDVNYGVLGDIAKFFNWTSVIKYPPLAYPNPALFSIISIATWKWTGYNMILYYSALMAVPDDMIEAATIDGASRPTIFFRILFPMLKSTHYTSVILCVLGALKAFDNIWTLTKGGPGYATHFFSTYIYFRSVSQGRIGYASALATVLVILTLVLTIIQIRQYNKTLGAS